MAKASDNQFPKVLITEGAGPASPAVGDQALFIDSADHKLKRKNSSGTVATIEGGSVATDAIYDAKGDIPIGTGADTAAKLTVGSNGQVLTADSTQTTGVKWASASGAAVKDRRWLAGSAETTIDEFNDDSQDAAWVRVDGTGAASGNVTWLEGADVMSAQHTAADTGNASHGLVRPIGTAPATGDAWVTCLTMFAAPNTNYVLAGLVVSDGTTHGSGKQVFAELGSNATPANQLGLTAVAGSNWNNTGATVSSTLACPPIGTPVFIRLVYRGSSQWRADYSLNGVQWITGGSMVTQSSFTPADVGLYSRDGGSGLLSIASFDMIRRVAGVS